MVKGRPRGFQGAGAGAHPLNPRLNTHCTMYRSPCEHDMYFARFQFIFAAVLAVAAAAPSDPSYGSDIIEILRQNIDHNDDLSYQHS